MSFLDVITRAGDVTLDLDEVIIPPHSKITGKTLKEARIPEQTGLIILALKKNGAKDFIFNPGSDEILHKDDAMVVLGTNEQIEKLKVTVNL